jgi:hypothetical protein
MAFVASAMTLAAAEPSSAASVTIDGSGAGSNQQIELNDTSVVEMSNTSMVQISNANFQQAQSGDVWANSNTSVVGGVASGDASNINTTSVVIAADNAPAGATVNAGAGNATGGIGQAPVSAVSEKGSVLGASVVGSGSGEAAMLPVTGASQAIDVSAFRNAWREPVAVQAVALAKQSQLFSGAMLLVATLLSVIGALGGAWYARRREEGV